MARTRCEWARALLDRGTPGDVQQARELLEHAFETAGRLGQTEVLQRTVALKDRAAELAAAS